MKHMPEIKRVLQGIIMLSVFCAAGETCALDFGGGNPEAPLSEAVAPPMEPARNQLHILKADAAEPYIEVSSDNQKHHYDSSHAWTYLNLKTEDTYLDVSGAGAEGTMKLPLYATKDMQIIVQLQDKNSYDGEKRGLSRKYDLKEGSQVLEIPLSKFADPGHPTSSDVDLTSLQAVVLHYGKEHWDGELNKDHVNRVDQVNFNGFIQFFAASGETTSGGKVSPPPVGEELLAKASTFGSKSDTRGKNAWSSVVTTDGTNYLDVSKANIMRLPLNADKDMKVVVQMLDKNMFDGIEKGLSGPYDVKAGSQYLDVPLSQFNGKNLLKSQTVDLTAIREIIVHYGEEYWYGELNKEKGTLTFDEDIEFFKPDNS